MLTLQSVVPIHINLIGHIGAVAGKCRVCLDIEPSAVIFTVGGVHRPPAGSIVGAVPGAYRVGPVP